jgi:uncharacterized DUF497 family protein
MNKNQNKSKDADASALSIPALNGGAFRANQVKLERDDALVWQDTRHDYGEARMIAMGVIDARLYCVVYVDRDDARRVISLRKANYKEAMDYANQN